MGVTVDDLIGCPWFQQDLPTGALDMREQCLEQTRARVASVDYEHVREYLLLAAQEYLAGSAAGSPAAGVPSGVGWLPEVPEGKQQHAAGMAISDWMAGFSVDGLPSAGGHTDAAASGYGKAANGWGGDNGRSNGRNGTHGRSAAAKTNGMVNGRAGGEVMTTCAAGMDGAGMGAADMGDGDGE